MRLLIVALLGVMFLVPGLMADENRDLWPKSTFVQSAKINYQHVYRKTKLREDLNHSIELIEEAIKKFPKDPELYFMLGTFYAEVNAVDTMAMYFDSVEIYCNDESLDKKIRKECFKGDNYIEKIEKFRQDAWEKSYNSAVEFLNQFDTAMAWKERASTEDSIQMLDSLAQLAYAKADTAFEEAAVVKPLEAKTYNAQGILHEHAGHYQEAAECYKQALAINGESAEAISRVAYAYIQIPNWDSSIVYFEKLLEYKPKDINSHINLSVAYNSRENFAKAHEHTEKILELDPNNIPAHFNAGQYFFMQMQNAALAISEVPDSLPGAAEKKEELNQKVNKYRDKAVSHFESILEIQPNDADALRQLGILYLLSGENEKAAGVFEKYVELNPNDLDVLDYLGRAYINVPNYEKAVGVYEKITEIDRGNLDAWERLKELYSATGKEEKAATAEAKVEELKNL